MSAITTETPTAKIAVSSRGADLPVSRDISRILETIANNPVTVIAAETGAGKSTQIPKALLEAGYDVIVTQPRRIAARSVASRVAEELGEKLGERVGFKTGEDSCSSGDTRLLFCTDGLQMVRELVGKPGRRTVLVLDEVHEMNINIEVLIAWAEQEIRRGGDLKLVLMSATIDHHRLAAFFGNNGQPAPTIEVPGRLFPVAERPRGASICDDVETLVKEGRNVLVFQPGKTEISDTIEALNRRGIQAEILPLHGELDHHAQTRCFKRYGRPKVIVSTNVAQTSVTIPDVDAVVDCGLERRVEVRDGVEGLYLQPISLADREQRKGRAGRTKEGIYIDHCPKVAGDRNAFPVPEIQRVRLDTIVLRLSMAGLDIERLRFLHQPPRSEIQKARESLRLLGCIDDNGITPMGRAIERLPVAPPIGRMVIEARKRGGVDDIISIAAIIEAGGIAAYDRDGGNMPAYRRFCPDERESDLLAQLAVMKGARDLKKPELIEAGVNVKAYFRAMEIRRKISAALRSRGFTSEAKASRDDLLKSICAGMIGDVMIAGAGGCYVNAQGVQRLPARDSVVARGACVVGVPFDIQIRGRRGSSLLQLLTNVTVVTPAMLGEVAPHMVTWQRQLNPRYDPGVDSIVSESRMVCNGLTLVESTEPTPHHPDSGAILAAYLTECAYSAGRWGEFFNHHPEHAKAIGFIREQLAACARFDRLSGQQPCIEPTREQLQSKIIDALKGARRIKEIPDGQRLALRLIDEGQEGRMSTDYPEQLACGSQVYAIRYERGSPPLIIVDIPSNAYEVGFRLPDNDVVLPDGRAITFRVRADWLGSFSSSSVAELKKKIVESWNDYAWKCCNTPEIPLPSIGTAAEDVAPVVTYEFARCPLSAAAMQRFGAVALASDDTSSESLNFEVRWFTTLEVAEAARAQVCNRLIDLCRQRLQEAERKAAEERAIIEGTESEAAPGPAAHEISIREELDDLGDSEPVSAPSPCASPAAGFNPSELFGGHVTVQRRRR
jgi:hypothetical protein